MGLFRWLFRRPRHEHKPNADGWGLTAGPSLTARCECGAQLVYFGPAYGIHVIER